MQIWILLLCDGFMLNTNIAISRVLSFVHSSTLIDSVHAKLDLYNSYILKYQILELASQRKPAGVYYDKQKRLCMSEPN